MHFIATYLFFFIDYALRTSENVPSPFLLINLYSLYMTNLKFTMHSFNSFTKYLNIYTELFFLKYSNNI